MTDKEKRLLDYVNANPKGMVAAAYRLGRKLANIELMDAIKAQTKCPKS